MRSSNIELLRIIAIIGVFFLHFYNPLIGGGIVLCKSTANEFLLRFIESQFSCSVNLFVLISGYFLSQSSSRSWLKPIQLIVQVIAFKVAIYLILVIVGRVDFALNEFIFNFLPQNWFVVLYIVLYICSPYLNIIINVLNSQQYKKLVIILLIIFSLYPTIVDVLSQWTGNPFNGLSTVGMYGSQYGYTIVQFVLMYMIGGFLVKNPSQLSRVQLLLSSVMVVLLITGWSYVDKISGYKIEPSAWEYCNPFVILEAVLLFMLFSKFEFKNKLINRLSAACFTFYLLHSVTYGFIDIEWIVNSHPIVMIILIALNGICTYIVCFIIYYLYHKFTYPVFKYLSIKCIWKF